MAYLGFINTCRLSGGGALHAAKEALCRLANGFAWYWCDVCQHEIVPCTNLFNNPLPHTHTHTERQREVLPLSISISVFSSCISPVHLRTHLFSSHSANITVCMRLCCSVTFWHGTTSYSLKWTHQPSCHGSLKSQIMENSQALSSAEGPQTPLWI